MKWVISIAVVPLVVSVAGAFPSLPATESVKSRLQIAIRTLSTESGEAQLKAIAEIQSLGPWGSPAIPAMSKVLLESSPQIASEIADTIARLGTAGKEANAALVEVVGRPRLDTYMLRACARAIAAIGDAGNSIMVRAILSVESGGRKVGAPVEELMSRYPAEVIPVVADHLNDPDVQIRSRAAMYLYRVIRRNQEDKPAIVDSLAIDVRKRIIDRLHEALADSSFRARNWVVPAIVDMDRTKLREAMPVFVTLIRRQDAYGVSQESIARRGPDAARIIIDYLDDPNPNVRQELASLLARCHGKIVPVLASGLRHPNPAIRAGVLNALSMNPAHGRSLRSAIINRLNDDDPQVQFAAATTLVTLDPKKADAAVPVFVDASFSRDALHRLRGIAWLQTMGPEARGAVPALFRHVNSTDVATRLAAAQALAAIDKSTWRSFVPALMDTIASGEVYQRTSAATLLGRTGPNARASLPALRAMLSDEHHPNRLVSAEAMIQIDPDDIDDSIETFANALKVDSDNNRSLRTVRRQAITAISRIGAPAKPTVPALLDVMRNESNEHVAMLAASTAIKLDPDKCDEAYDRFRLHLQPTHPDPDDIWLDGIVQLGKAAKPLLPNLIEAINGKATYQRYAVLEALTMLGPDAKEALPALKDLAKTKKGPSGVDDAIKAIEGKK